MEIKEWIDSKVESIKYGLDDFFCSDAGRNRLQSTFVYPIFCKIMSTGNSYDDIHTRIFNEPSDVMYCLDAFQNIVAEINMKVVFVPSIENFCIFMGWTANVYKQMLNDSPTEIQAVMHMIDDFIIESQMSAGQNGFSKASLTKFRSQLAGDHGMNFVTQKEENDSNKNKNKVKTPEELQKELNDMGFKLLEKNTK